MLIPCPECQHMISDKAMSCPQCGYPLKDPPKITTRGKSRKRKRLPNGFGQITKIKSNLRNPYRAMITVGKTKEGKPICKLLKPKSYFETYNDAYSALVEYNRNPYDLKPDITCQELYDRWLAEYSKVVKSSAYKSALSIWAYCSELYDVPIANIRVRHIKGVIENGISTSTGRSTSPIMKNKIKILWNMLFDYAVEYELVEKNYARMFTLKEKQQTEKEHISFTDQEMSILWKYKDDPIVSMILIQCYTGWRPRELITLTLENINLEQNTMLGGMKTDAGQKRIVIVIPTIKPLVQKWYDQAQNINSNHLFNLESKPYTYAKYSYRFDQTMKRLNLNINHRPHDPRKQFVTMCKRVNMDEYAIKRLAGHTIRDVTEKIYTDRDLEWLMKESFKLNSLHF